MRKKKKRLAKRRRRALTFKDIANDLFPAGLPPIGSAELDKMVANIINRNTKRMWNEVNIRGRNMPPRAILEEALPPIRSADLLPKVEWP